MAKARHGGKVVIEYCISGPDIFLFDKVTLFSCPTIDFVTVTLLTLALARPIS